MVTTGIEAATAAMHDSGSKHKAADISIVAALLPSKKGYLQLKVL
jgi:hypothetical protein